MHEMTIALNVIDIVTKIAAEDGASKINSVEIEVGQLAGILIDSLEFSFQAATKNTKLEATKLKIIPKKGIANCLNCTNEFEIDTFFKPCPKCGDYKVKIVQGKNLNILSINVD